MNLKKALLAGAALIGMCAVPAQASIVDNPHFKVLGLVIVWSGDASGNPVVNDFVIGTGSGGTDLIGGLGTADGTAVVTGTLNQRPALTGQNDFDVDSVPGVGTLDASAAFSAFTLDETTDVSVDNELSSSFYVASNTPFNISANATDTTVGTTDFTLANVAFAMSHTNADAGDVNNPDFGIAANATVGSVQTGFDTLADLDGSTVFVGSDKTAATRGSIMEQSVRFDVTYTLGGAQGYDLSLGAGEIEADVVYTVFVP